MENGKIYVFLYNGETIIGKIDTDGSDVVKVESPVKVKFSLKLGSSDTGNSDSAIISWELTPFFYDSLFIPTDSDGTVSAARVSIFDFPNDKVVKSNIAEGNIDASLLNAYKTFVNL